MPIHKLTISESDTDARPVLIYGGHHLTNGLGINEPQRVSPLSLVSAGRKELKEMIGHSDISMTDRYSHLSVNHRLIMEDLPVDHYSSLHMG